jgi:hypothetical protein
MARSPMACAAAAGALALTLALALAGCSTSDGSGVAASTKAPTSDPTSGATAVAALVPLSLSPLDRTTATTEGKRLADAVQGLIPSSELLYVDDHDQLTAASGGDAAFYGIARVISLEPADDPRAMAASMIQTLEASGWTVTRTTDDDGLTLTALVATSGGQRWLILLGSDTTVEGQSVINLQLASPDLP